MVAYSFQAQFEDPILRRTKRQTLRAVGKRRHARPGETLQLYTGMRTRSCRLVLETVAAVVGEVTINFDEPAVLVRIGTDAPTYFRAKRDRDAFASSDGFASWETFVDFWRVNHFKKKPPTGVWTGVIVKW